MTACVNKHTKRVAAVVTASLVGALSLGVAPVAAMATDSVDMLTHLDKVWDNIDFAWNVDPDAFGNYSISVGDQFLLNSATDPFGTPVSMSDLTVLYFEDSATDGTKGEFSSYDAACTSMPKHAGTYFAVIVNGKVDPDTISGWLDFSDKVKDKFQYKVVTFKAQAKSLEGAFAYEGTDVSDTSFKYTGIAKTVNFADADGNKLVKGEDYTVKSFKAVGAGDYTVTLHAVKDSGYEGSATVRFTVDPIDLKNDVFTVAPIQANGSAFTSGKLVQSSNAVFVNGERLDENVVNVSIAGGVDWQGKPLSTSWNGNNNRANVELNVAANPYYKSADHSYSVDDFVDYRPLGTAETVVVKSVLTGDFFYDGEKILDTNVITVDTAKGEAFDPALLSAYIGQDKVPCTWTAYKDGEQTTDFTQPGEYKLNVAFVIPEDLEYAGSIDVTVNVVSKHYSEQPKVFAAIDGKDAKDAVVEYDGEAVEPVIVAKAGSATIDPADYTVTYTDADGEAVESVVEPGKYTGTVDFGNAQYWTTAGYKDVDPVTFTFEVTKAKINSAKADKDVYDMTGEAVTPKFTAYTGEDLTGLSVEIDPAEVGVTYYEAKLDNNGTWWTDEDDEWVADESKGAIKASDLKKAGKYIARVTVPADDPHLQGTIDSEMFQISEYATFSDVAADAWYADAVYNAADLGYMTGIKGTDLFMPLADISRAELSKVFFNMAGQSEEEGVYFPSAFADVDGWAWYAQPVAWASEAGIVTGYDADTFGPMDKASREQVAVMLYRYAKAQGKDVSVKDADAALAAYKDGDQVSDWAKTAMAWAVENGIFGVDTDELWANQNIQRAAVASIAVRFQPEALPEA